MPGMMYAFKLSSSAVYDAVTYQCEHAGHEGPPRRAEAVLINTTSELDDVVGTAVEKVCPNCVPKFVAIHEGE